MSRNRGETRRPWADEESATLTRMHAEGAGWSAIGTMIGRSRSSCYEHWKVINKTPETQTCSKCGKTKSLDLFHRRTGILSSACISHIMVCKECVRKQLKHASAVSHGKTVAFKFAGPAMWDEPEPRPLSVSDYKTRLLARVRGADA